MRVYVPSTDVALRELLATGELGPAPITAFAVTPALREWYLDDDVESLEYAAMAEAARGSLRLLDADPAAARRRVVVAADVDDAAVTVHDDLERGVVRIGTAIATARVASVHIDDLEAEPTVRTAADAVIEADLGSASAQERVDDAEGFDLSWYATQELAHLLDTL